MTLVLHRREGLLACHHCGHRERVPSRCPDCGSVSIARHGTGTERLEAELDARRPGVPPRRRRAATPAPVLARFQAAPRGHPRRHADGGQGPRLPRRRPRRRRRRRRHPALPGLPRRGADVRAGRPSSPAARAAARWAGACSSRRSRPRRARSSSPRSTTRTRSSRASSSGARALRYPPFSTLVRIVVLGEPAGAAQAAAAAVKERLVGGAAGAALGPAPLFRLRGRERAQVVVKAAERRRRGGGDRRGGPGGRRGPGVPRRELQRGRRSAVARRRPWRRTCTTPRSRRSRSPPASIPSSPRAAPRRSPSASSGIPCCGRRPGRSRSSTTRCATRSRGWAALMHDSMGIGLAATQVGALQRLLVYRVEHDSPVNVADQPGTGVVGQGEGVDGGGLPEPAAASTSRSSGPSTCGSGRRTQPASRSRSRRPGSRRGSSSTRWTTSTAS